MPVKKNKTFISGIGYLLSGIGYLLSGIGCYIIKVMIFYVNHFSLIIFYYLVR